MNLIGTRELETARLKLRKITSADAQPLRLSGSLQGTEEEVRQRVARLVAQANDPASFHWVIEHEGSAIGRITAWEVSQRDEYAQLGYDLAPWLRGRGLMPEAMRAVVKYLLDEVGLHRVYCQVRESNTASLRACEKAGLRHEATLRGHFREPDGSFVDVRIYAILREELNDA